MLCWPYSLVRLSPYHWWVFKLTSQTKSVTKRGDFSDILQDCLPRVCVCVCVCEVFAQKSSKEHNVFAERSFGACIGFVKFLPKLFHYKKDEKSDKFEFRGIYKKEIRKNHLMKKFNNKIEFSTNQTKKFNKLQTILTECHR